MDLNKILYFQVVAELGSISKACQVVHLSQPALSIQMQGLEAELGVTLFKRYNRGLILTEEGKLLLERARLLKEWTSETKDYLGQVKAPTGGVRVGTYTTASSYLLSPILKDFFSQYPNIEILYDYSPTDTLIQKLKAMNLDCVIVSEAPEEVGIKAKAFFKSELILVCAEKSKIPSRLSPEGLSEHPFLSYPLKHDYCYREVERKFGRFLKKSTTPISSESFETLKQGVLSDLGMSFMPEYLIKTELSKKVMRKIDFTGSKLPIEFSLLVTKGSKLPRRVEVFREFVLESFR